MYSLCDETHIKTKETGEQMQCLWYCTVTWIWRVLSYYQGCENVDVLGYAELSYHYDTMIVYDTILFHYFIVVCDDNETMIDDKEWADIDVHKLWYCEAWYVM